MHAAVMLAEGGRVKRPYRLAAALIAGLALGMGVPLSLGGGHGTALAETLSLRPDEALGMAKLAYQAGDHATANHLARALLLVDARDPLVLLLLAATEPKLGNPKAGIKAGRLAWGEARRREAPDGLRWEIARNTAKAAYDADQMGLAQWWLRRSLDVAPDKDALGVSGKDLAEVRAQNRLHWSFDLAIGPSDNLNGGASDPVFRVDDTVIGFLSNGAGAVGGTRAQLSLGAKYALPQSATGQTVLGFSASALVNRIDPADRARAGNLRSKDLNQTTVAASLRRDMPKGLVGLPLSLEVRASGTWAGGDWVGPALGGSAVLPVWRRDAVSLWLAASAERRWTHGATDTQDVVQLTGFGSVTLPRDQALSFSLGLERALSDRRNASYDAVTLAMGYDPGWHIGPAEVDLNLNLGFRRYDVFSLGFAQVTNGRSDTSYGVGMDVTLPDWGVMGFAPVVSIDLGRTDSNVSRYQTKTRSISLGLTQVF